MPPTSLDAPQILQDKDPEIAQAIKNEIDRQQNSLVLIASENHASQAVMDASSTVLRTSTQRATPASATTVAASTWTLLRPLPSTG